MTDRERERLATALEELSELSSSCESCCRRRASVERLQEERERERRTDGQTDIQRHIKIMKKIQDFLTKEEGVAVRVYSHVYADTNNRNKRPIKFKKASCKHVKNVNVAYKTHLVCECFSIKVVEHLLEQSSPLMILLLRCFNINSCFSYRSVSKPGTVELHQFHAYDILHFKSM